MDVAKLNCDPSHQKPGRAAPTAPRAKIKPRSPRLLNVLPVIPKPIIESSTVKFAVLTVVVSPLTVRSPLTVTLAPKVALPDPSRITSWFAAIFDPRPIIKSSTPFSTPIDYHQWLL